MYLKAFVGAALAGLGATGVALEDGSIGGQEWVTIVAATLVALGGVWAVPNKPA